MRYAFILAILIAATIALTSFKPIAFAPLPTNSDLYIAKLEYPLGPQDGSEIGFSITVANGGTGSSEIQFKVALYIDGVNVANASAGPLDAGENTTLELPWKAQTQIHDVYILVDPDDEIGELNENNNALNATVSVDWPADQQSVHRTGFGKVNAPTDPFVKWNWTCPADGVSNQPLLISSNKVIIACDSGLYAINAFSGAQVWGVEGSYGTLGSIAQNQVYVGDSPTATVYALSLNDGSQIWLDSGLGSVDATFAIYSNGYVYTSNDQSIKALNSSDGTVVWETALLDYPLYAPIIFNDTLYFTVANDVQAFNSLDGTGKWTYTATNIPTFLLLKDLLYVQQYDPATDLAMLFALDPTSGVQVWSSSLTTSWIAPAYHNGKLFVPNRTKLFVLNATNGNQITNYSLPKEASTPAIVSENGLILIGLFDPVTSAGAVVALDEANGNQLWTFSLNAQPFALALWNETLIIATVGAADSNLYALAQKPNISIIIPSPNFELDRDSVSSAPDSVTLVANLSDGASGINVEFHARRTDPATPQVEALLGSNTSSNGLAYLSWNPDSTFAAGNFTIWATAQNYNTIENTTVLVYGGLNASFRYPNMLPGTSYSPGQNITIEALLGYYGLETTEELIQEYNLIYTATLPHGTVNLTNQTYEIVYDLGDGSVNSCWDSDPNDQIDFVQDLVPSPVPVTNTPAGYYLKWTCGTNCPSYDQKIFSITSAIDSDSWNALDSFTLAGFTACTGTPGTDCNGWTFGVFNNTTAEYWNATQLLKSYGTWVITINASANWYYNSSDERTVNVPVPEKEVVVSVSPKPIYTLSAEFENVVFEDGIGKLSIGRKSSQGIKITIRNTGTHTLYNVKIQVKGLPYGWAIVRPVKIDKLAPGESKYVDLLLFIPAEAELRQYDMNIEIVSLYTRSTYAFLVTVTAQCEPCPQPGPWSTCKDGKMYRTNYRCGADTNFKCVEWLEERECAELPATKPKEIAYNVVIFALIAIFVGALIIGVPYWKK